MKDSVWNKGHMERTGAWENPHASECQQYFEGIDFSPWYNIRDEIGVLLLVTIRSITDWGMSADSASFLDCCPEKENQRHLQKLWFIKSWAKQTSQLLNLCFFHKGKRNSDTSKIPAQWLYSATWNLCWEGYDISHLNSSLSHTVCSTCCYRIRIGDSTTAASVAEVLKMSAPVSRRSWVWIPPKNTH